MNILIDDLDKIVANRIKVPFNTDFRYGIMFELLMQDTSLSDEVKIIESIKIFYPSYKSITDYPKAIKDIMWFYQCGKEPEEEVKQKERNTGETHIYSYEYDQDYIYSAFLDQYGINLARESLHWWEFRALWNGLRKENKIVEIMGYRSINISEIKDKTEKNRYKKLKKIYALPDMRTEAQKENDFGSAFW